MTLALRVGEEMVANAESVTECVAGMRRILEALGVPDCSVVVEMNEVVLSWLPTADDGGGEPITLMRVVSRQQQNFSRLVAVHKLTGAIERGEIGLAGAQRALDEASQLANPYPAALVTLARLTSVAGWTVFSGGDAVAVAVAVAGSALVLPVLDLARRTRVPDAFVTFLGALLVALAPFLALWGGLEFVVSAAVIGSLYQFLPGQVLVSAVSDGLSGAPVSAVARGLQAVVVAVAVALGVLLALDLTTGLDVTTQLAVNAYPWWVSMAAAATAVGSLAVARQVPRLALVPVVALGALVWFVANVATGGDWERELAVGVGAFVLGLAGQLLSRLQRTVPVLYTGAAVLVLLPGSLLYLAMLALASDLTSEGARLIVQALSVAVAIAAGTTLGVSAGWAVPGFGTTWRLVGRNRPVGSWRTRGVPRSTPPQN
jgi:uncharacterized membrane protein YjjP (DUF1212 family)